MIQQENSQLVQPADLDPTTSVEERNQLIEVCKSDLEKMQKE